MAAFEKHISLLYPVLSRTFVGKFEFWIFVWLYLDCNIMQLYNKTFILIELIYSEYDQATKNVYLLLKVFLYNYWQWEQLIESVAMSAHLCLAFCKKKNFNMGKAIRKSSTLLLLNSVLCVIHKDKAME